MPDMLYTVLSNIMHTLTVIHCPQILDVVDGTGSGDVDTSTVRKADSEGIVVGAYGTKLHLKTTWKNPSGEDGLMLDPYRQCKQAMNAIWSSSRQMIASYRH